MKKVQCAVDYIKGRTSVKEMTELPNRYMQYYYHENYVRMIEAERNPEGRAAKELQSQAMVDQLSGMV